jgi:hypothetical protein
MMHNLTHIIDLCPYGQVINSQSDYNYCFQLQTFKIFYYFYYLFIFNIFRGSDYRQTLSAF